MRNKGFVVLLLFAVFGFLVWCWRNRYQTNESPANGLKTANTVPTLATANTGVGIVAAPSNLPTAVNGLVFKIPANLALTSPYTVPANTVHSLSFVAISGGFSVKIGDGLPVQYPAGTASVIKAEGGLLGREIVFTPHADTTIYLHTIS